MSELYIVFGWRKNEHMIDISDIIGGPASVVPYHYSGLGLIRDVTGGSSRGGVRGS